jgi:hypothetical protein
MICNVDEMMVQPYNSRHTYMFVVWFFFFKFQPCPTVKFVALESVPVDVSKSLVPKKGTRAPSFKSSLISLFSISFFGSALFYSVYAPIVSPFPFPSQHMTHS